MKQKTNEAAPTAEAKPEQGTEQQPTEQAAPTPAPRPRWKYTALNEDGTPRSGIEPEGESAEADTTTAAMKIAEAAGYGGVSFVNAEGEALHFHASNAQTEQAAAAPVLRIIVSPLA